MTTVLGDTETSSSPRIYSQVSELEKELKALVKEKRAFHPDVRSVRTKLREKYVEIILTDPEVCEKHDTPTGLWNWVFYIIIEEFRNRIRYIGNDQSIPVAEKTPRVVKLLAGLRNFIGEATKFYSALILKLKKKYGLQQEGFTFGGPEYESLLLNSKRSAEFRKTCHRFFINLGDLARYKELHSDGEAYAPDWRIPAEHYFKALSLWSATGHPHNQLAVLATYMQNDFLAVYHYFRSLGVDDPFITARGNLIMTFDQNRQQYAEVLEQKRPAEAQQKKGRAGKDVAAMTKAENSEIEEEVKRTFFIRFVRLNGILFTKTSLETFAEVFTETFQDLEKVLSLNQERLESLFSSHLHRSEDASRVLSLGLLQLVSIMIFAVPSGSSRSSYADALQHTTIAKYAITACFKLAGYLMSTCAESEGVAESPFLPASLVFMEWLSTRPDIVAGSPADDERQSGARAGFWKDSLALLNRICDTEDYDEFPQVKVALWEDRELAGFAPLSPVQSGLDFNKKHPNEEKARLNRLVAAGKSIAKVLDGSTGSLGFDEDMDIFYLGGEKRERRSKEKVVTKSQVQNPTPVEEDEEEVIVFQPLVKVTPDSTLPSGENGDHRPSARIPAQSDLYGTAKQNEVYRPPVAAEVKSDVSFGSFGLPTDIEFNKSFASTEMTSSSYVPAPSTPSYSLAPSSYSHAPSTYYGPDTITGINGPASTSLGTAGMDSFNSSFSTYASFAQDLLSKLSASKEHMRSTAFTDTTKTLPSEVEYVKAPDLRRDTAPARMKPVVPPPPGFGPIPQRAVSNQNLPAKSEWLWMKNFNSDARPLFSANPDIWSYSSTSGGIHNGLPIPRSAAYPFPGMGVDASQQSPMGQPVQGTWNPEPSVPRPAPRAYRPPDYVS